MAPKDNVRKALPITIGATAFVAGADKFFNLLTGWKARQRGGPKHTMPDS